MITVERSEYRTMSCDNVHVNNEHGEPDQGTLSV